MLRWLCVLLLLLPVTATPSASAEWTTGAGQVLFDPAPICSYPSSMTGEATYQRWPGYEDGYLALALVDPLCPDILDDQPVIFHGWLTDEGACFVGSFLLSEATLCLTDATAAGVMYQFDARLCVDAFDGAWCSSGKIVFLLV